MSDPDAQLPPWFEPLYTLLAASLVRIVMVDRLVDPRADESDWERRFQPGLETFTGFAICLNGRVAVLTAGHIIERIRTLSTRGRQSARFQIDVGFGLSSSPTQIRIPTGEFVALQGWDEYSGHDYGALLISNDVALQMEEAQCKPFSPSTWEGDHFEATDYFVLGFPKEFRQGERWRDGDRAGVLETSVFPMLPIEPLRDDSREEGQIPQFKGQVLTRVGTLNGVSTVLSDLNGMSGGPIVAIRPNETGCLLRLLAIQVVGTPDGVIYGCWVKHLTDSLRGQFEAMPDTR